MDQRAELQFVLVGLSGLEARAMKLLRLLAVSPLLTNGEQAEAREFSFDELRHSLFFKHSAWALGPHEYKMDVPNPARLGDLALLCRLDLGEGLAGRTLPRFARVMGENIGPEFEQLALAVVEDEKRHQQFTSRVLDRLQQDFDAATLRGARRLSRQVWVVDQHVLKFREAYNNLLRSVPWVR